MQGAAVAGWRARRCNTIGRMDTAAAARIRFWSRTRVLTGVLLLAWLLVNLLTPWFARDLSGLFFFGFPLGFWLAAEGALLMYLLLIVVYVLAMERLEDTYLAARAEEEASPPTAGAERV